MKLNASRGFRLLALAAAVLLGSQWGWADSQVRIVRLSSVDGEVQVDRATGAGFEKAFLNLPVTQGVQLQTGADGRAEVEFEDNSTLRLAPGSLVEFSELGLQDSGTKASVVKVQRGIVYVEFRGNKDEDLVLNFGRESLHLKDAAHFRVQMKDAVATLAVFKGEVTVQGASGEVAVGKNRSASFDLADHDKYQVSGGVGDEPFDTWDKEQGKFHDSYAGKKSESRSYGYGASDLNYYGNFFNAPGYGMMWQPYLVGAGWDPFMDGNWAWFPGSGFGWVSSYPWGWTPYHCGSWMFLPAFGWAWQPGPCFGGFGFPQIIHAPSGFRVPQPPAAPPAHGTIVTLRPRPIGTPFRAEHLLGPVGVSSRPRPFDPVLEAERKLVIENNSAGLGIPRGAIRDFHRFSNQVEQHGSATVTFRAPAAFHAPSAPASSGMHGSPGNAPRPSGSTSLARPPASSTGSSMGSSHSAASHGTTRK
jgi:hypothetical protein